MKGEGLRASAIHLIAIVNMKAFPEIFNVSTQRRFQLKVVKNKLPPNAHAKMCNQNCRGTGLVTPSVLPLPYEQLCLYPLLISRCFWKDSLMTPTTPPQASFTVATLPIHHFSPPPPPPLPEKRLIIRNRLLYPKTIGRGNLIQKPQTI